MMHIITICNCIDIYSVVSSFNIFQIFIYFQSITMVILCVKNGYLLIGGKFLVILGYVVLFYIKYQYYE